jgi:hypothetical protein
MIDLIDVENETFRWKTWFQSKVTGLGANFSYQGLE